MACCNSLKKKPYAPLRGLFINGRKTVTKRASWNTAMNLFLRITKNQDLTRKSHEEQTTLLAYQPSQSEIVNGSISTFFWKTKNKPKNQLPPTHLSTPPKKQASSGWDEIRKNEKIAEWTSMATTGLENCGVAPHVGATPQIKSNHVACIR